MNDPEVHPTTGMGQHRAVGAPAHHNYIHHKYTNVLGMDDDVGYGLPRVTRDQRWRPFYLGNLVHNTPLAVFRGWRRRPAPRTGPQTQDAGGQGCTAADLADVGAKIGRQVGKDYVVVPGRRRRDRTVDGRARATMGANFLG